MKILVIDDEPNILDWSEIVFKQKGYAVSTSLTAQEGLKKYKQEKPDLILLDLAMPDTSGEEMIKKIYKENPTQKIIIFTGVGIESIPTHLKILPIIIKPISKDELLTKIDEVLAASSNLV